MKSVLRLANVVWIMIDFILLIKKLNFSFKIFRIGKKITFFFIIRAFSPHFDLAEKYSLPMYLHNRNTNKDFFS